MAFWSSIANTVKRMVKGMIGARTIEQTLHVSPAISSQMEEAITMWSDMYKNRAPWLKEPTYADPSRVTSLGLPALIASEKARMALIEMQSEITTPTEEVEIENPDYQEPEPDVLGNIIPSVQPPMITEDRPKTSTDRAEYLNKQYEKLKKDLRRQLEYGIAKGGLVFKPYVVLNKATDDGNSDTTADIEFNYIQADCFYPLSFDASGKITEAAFIETKASKDVIYRRLEYHKWENNKVQVINKAFKSTNVTNEGDMTGVDLGQDVPLTEIPEWKDMPPNTTIQNVDKPLFAYFKMPEANTIDTASPLGASGYARAVNLIKDADMQYSRLLWEYEGGEMAIDIDRDAMQFRTGSDGKQHTVMNHLQARLFRTVDLGQSDTYQPYAPSLRDASYIQGVNEILMRIEDTCALSRGTLSNVIADARTATELKILKQRSFSANQDIQQALEETLKDVVYIMNAYCDLYEITPDGEYDISFEWDDSILVDAEEELTKRITLQQNGLASKLENRMWYFGETERQAREALIKIEEESRQEMEDNLIMQTNEFNRNQNANENE